MKNTELVYLGQREWLNQLLDANTLINLDLAETPGFFRPPWEWDNRVDGIAEHLLHYIVEGEVSVRVGSAEITTRSGDLFWIAPREPFRIWNPVAQKTLVYRFRLRVNSGRRNYAFKQKLVHVRSALGARLWFEQIVKSCESEEGHGLNHFYHKGLCLSLFTEMFKSLNIKNNERTKGLSHEQCRLIQDYVSKHSDRRIEPAMLARHLGYAPNYFSRLFKKRYGISSRKWIVEERIRHAAARLLESKESITRIAMESGYEDLFFFSRQFRQVMGCSPRQYRNA